MNYFQDSKAIYINSLYSYYRGEDPMRDQIKRRQELTPNIEVYTNGVDVEDKKDREEK